MATTRDAALVNTDIILQAQFQMAVTFQPFDPASISKVEILDTDGTTILQTITGSNIKRVQAGVYEVVGLAVNYDVAGIYFDRWYATLEAGGAESAYTKQTMVLNTVSVSSYCTVQDMRDEGYSSTAYPDARVARATRLATEYIDRMCGQWFAPRYFTEETPFLVDGNNQVVLWLPVPVIDVEKITITSGIDGTTLYEIDLESVMVYNRHLRGQVAGIDDDRENPRLEMRRATRREMRLYDDIQGRWPNGSANIQLVGYFGYTDYDPGSVRGKTPELIKHAAKLLTEMELAQFARRQQRDTLRQRHRVIGQATKDQSVSLAQLISRGLFTGNPEIDGILTSYRRAPYVGSA